MITDPAATFLQEAQDLFEQLESALLDLERSPRDRDLVDTAFRALHTIKGSGSMFGFDALARFTHHLETAFDRVRKGEVAPSRELIGVTLAAIDHMRALLQGTVEPGDTVGVRLIASLEALVGLTREGSAAGKAAARPAAEAEDVTWRIRFSLPVDALIRGTNPLVLLDELRDLGSCTVVGLADRVPPLEEIDPSSCYAAWDVVLTTKRPRAAIDDVFIFVIDEMDLQVQRLDEKAADLRLGEILVARGDIAQPIIEAALETKPLFGQVLVGGGAVSEDKIKAALAEQQHLRHEGEAARAQAPASESIRVQAERLDELMDRVGELVIAQARLKQLAAGIGDAHLKSVAEDIERLSNELRDTTMGIRMVPIASLFGRFRRLVRDLSQDLGKTITLAAVGEETELDKTVIERLADPLVHLIRNAIDNGIEAAPQRRAAGKPDQGCVQLSAVHSGAEVLISVKDDGRGLDGAQIRARAEEQGLIAAGTKLTDGELFQYIFRPGFSTAREVTNVSGRGVGMDVVKRGIEALRGEIDVFSQPGQGTEVTLRLPLTLAIIDGLLVRVGKGRYVIPLAAVEECVELSVEEDLRHSGRNFLNIRGGLVPFMRLRDEFRSRQPADPYQKVVIVSTGERRIGLVVDQVIGDHQTVIKSLSKLHAAVDSFSGASILGDGTVALILDVGHLIEHGQGFEPSRKAS